MRKEEEKKGGDNRETDKISLEEFFQELSWRGLIANSANLESFYQLRSNEKVVYLGIDCTSTSLHIGHLFLLLQSIRFIQKGFQFLLILGGATSQIGDPSDKLKERPQLGSQEIENYEEKIKKQLVRVLGEAPQIENLNFSPLEEFYGDSPELLKKIYQTLKIEEKEEKNIQWKKYLSYIWPLKESNFQILNNADWLKKLSFVDFINEVGRNISINYLLAKETIKKRLETGLSYSAFSYSLLQAYDFYYLYQNYNCHGQLGGSDQWGNLTTGLKLIRSFYPESKVFAFNFPLLTDKDGKKLSKSESGMKILWLDSNQEEFYEFFRNMPDEQAKVYLKQFTFLNENQINELIVLNNPSKLRIPQRVLYELIFLLNYRHYKLLREK